MNLTKEMKTWYGLVATFGTVGRFTKMPGTMGSIAACVVWIVFGGLPLWVIIAAAIVGTIAADKYEKVSGRKDPGEVVIDEAVGTWISCWGLPISYAIVALFAFRIVDITKPFPISQTEKLPGGYGIMADDIVGGIIVNIAIRVIFWIFFLGGLAAIYAFFGR